MFSWWNLFNFLLVFFLSYQVWKVAAFDQVIIFLVFLFYFRFFFYFIAFQMSDFLTSQVLIYFRSRQKANGLVTNTTSSKFIQGIFS